MRRLRQVGIYFGVVDPGPEDHGTWPLDEPAPLWRVAFAACVTGLLVGVLSWLVTDWSFGRALAFGLTLSLVNVVVNLAREGRFRR